jgi:hypothetical protein
VKLTGEQMEALVTALSEKLSLDELRRLTKFKLGQNYANLVSDGAKQIDAVFEIVDWADRHEKVPKLVEGARGLNPSLPELQTIFKFSEVDVVLPRDRQELQRVITERSKFQGSPLFRDKLARFETWVCRVEIPGEGGTALLVGEDLVLTNQHVMAPVMEGSASRDDVVFRFDFKALPDGTELVGETRCGLAAMWNVHSRPPSAKDYIVDGGEPAPDELDYALVRLKERVGRLPISSNDPQAPLRGWFALAAPPAIKVNEPLLILQYPEDLRLQLALGSVLKHSPDGLRLRHNARTLPGSSGSPCFDSNLELVALHHAGNDKYNQAIPMGRIFKDLENKAPPFWKDVPP